MSRRNWYFAAGGVVVVVVILVIVALVLADGDDDDVVAGDDTTTTTTDADTTTTTERETTTTTRGDGEAGGTIVAVNGDGEVVVLDPDSGEAEQVLMEGVRVDDPAKNDVAVAPERGVAFVVRPGESAEREQIVRVDLDTGATEMVAAGLSPSVSPDGDRLAYVVFEQDADPSPAPVLVIRDLDTGEERRLAREAEQQFHFIADTAWTADGERLALVVGEIRTGVHLVDADAGNLDGAERLGPELDGEDPSWRAVTAFGDDRLALIETCCDVPNRERWLVMAYDLSERTVEGGLLPEERVEASALDSPAGAARLVYVADLRPGGGTLHRWDGSGDPEVVSEGIVAAGW